MTNSPRKQICSLHSKFVFLFFKLIFLFIYLFLAVLGLRFCARAFSSCGKRGPLFIAVRGPLTIAALSLSRPLLLRSTGSRRAGPVIVAHGPSRSTACGILPDQGSNPCALHWQADFQPLRHQGGPCTMFKCTSYELEANFVIRNICLSACLYA